MHPSNLPPQQFPHQNQAQYPTLPPINNQHPQGQLAQPFIPQYGQPVQSPQTNISPEDQMILFQLKQIDDELQTGSSQACYSFWFIFVMILSAMVSLISIPLLPLIVFPLSILFTTYLLYSGQKSKNHEKARLYYLSSCVLLTMFVIPVIMVVITLNINSYSGWNGLGLALVAMAGIPCIIVIGVNCMIGKRIMDILEKRFKLIDSLDEVPYLNGPIGAKVN